MGIDQRSKEVGSVLWYLEARKMDGDVVDEMKGRRWPWRRAGRGRKR